MRGVVGESLLGNRFDVVDASDGGERVMTQVRADDQGLGFGVADAADAHISAHLLQIILKFGSELGVFDVVDGAFEALLAQHHHAAPAGPQMRVVIGSVKQVVHAIFSGNHAKKTAHGKSPFFQQRFG